MNATLSLFDDALLAPTAPTIRVKGCDPYLRRKATRKPAAPAPLPSAGHPTSTEALERHEASGALQTNKRRVLAALALHDGSTGAELALHVELSGDPTDRKYETRRRLDDLRRLGLVHQGERRQCRTKTRRARALTWWVGPGTAQAQNS